MILVLTGVQKYPFTRLLHAVKALESKYDFTVQRGYNDVEFDTATVFDFTESEEELIEYISKADIIITHGGVGSVFTSLRFHKKLIVVPRLKRYKEQDDDHQLELAEKLESEHFLEVLTDAWLLEEMIVKVERSNIGRYENDSLELIKRLDEYIESKL